MNNLAESLIEKLYRERSTWGAGVLSKTLQKHSLHVGGEITMRKAAEILDVPYNEIKIGGHLCKSYGKDSAKKIVAYILETPRSVREKEWLKLHPEEIAMREERLQNTLRRKHEELTAIKEARKTVKVWEVSAELHLIAHKLIELCARLNIHIIDNAINKTDIITIKEYLSEFYSGTPYERGRKLAAETWAKNNTGYVRGQKNSIARKENKEKNRKNLEKKLGLKCYTDVEAAQFIGKNNSTLISGMKLLGLPMHKIGGCYIYDEESLLKLKNFYNSKNGLKGQVARLFEEYVRSKRVDYTCEKTFKGCYWHSDSKHPLRFDYYFPKYNLVVEVQGAQHFRPTSMGATLTEEQIIKNFKGLKERDQIKRDYCMKNNINFIEIITKDDFKKFDAVTGR